MVGEITPEDDIEEALYAFRHSWDGRVQKSDKNIHTLTELGITFVQRADEIRGLSLEHYVSGPEDDHDGSGAKVWIFRKEVCKKMIYIKLRVINLNKGKKYWKCMSFHFPVWELKCHYAK